MFVSESGTCTLAIVMIRDVPNPEVLPGGAKKGPPSDTSSYRDLWKIAENVVTQCLTRRGQMGWQVTGMSSIIKTSRTAFH